MATIVNTPAHEHTHRESSNGLGFLWGAIILLVVVFLLFYFGLPLIRQATAPTTPNINVPGQIDINVKPQAPAPANPGNPGQ